MSYLPQDPYQSPPPVPYSPGPNGSGWHQPAPQPAYAQPVVFTQQVPASGVATASMIFGILGVLGGWCMLGVPCIIAVICGHAGLSQTKDGARSGRGQAVAGLIMGYVVVMPAIALFFLVVVGTIFGGATSPTATP
jgi:hypothetical protein